MGDELSMLWESTDPLVALQGRFRFDSVDAARSWLTSLLAESYGIAVDGIDRLVISAGNLLAWLSTPDGPIIAKCCAYPGIHQRRSAIGELLVWLHERGIPVSAPLSAGDGSVQVECDHLSVGVQRVVRGELLDPTDLAQARTGGEMLADLHRALADYPGTTDLAPSRPEPRIEFADWVHSADNADPELIRLIERRLDELEKIDTQLVHFDYRSGNILTDAGKIIAILDFEEVQPLPRVADAGHAAVLLGCRYHNWAPMSLESETAFLDAYDRAAGLDDNERNWLRLFQLRAAIGANASAWQGMIDRLAATVSRS